MIYHIAIWFLVGLPMIAVTHIVDVGLNAAIDAVIIS
jgi:hypothetical protein